MAVDGQGGNRPREKTATGGAGTGATTPPSPPLVTALMCQKPRDLQQQRVRRKKKRSKGCVPNTDVVTYRLRPSSTAAARQEAVLPARTPRGPMS